MPAVHKLREDFGIERMVMVGDRGMVSPKAIKETRQTDGQAPESKCKLVRRAAVELQPKRSMPSGGECRQILHLAPEHERMGFE